MAQALALEKAREISKIKAAARDGAEEKLIQHKTWQLQNKIEALPMQWETGQEGTVPRQVQQLQDDFDKWVDEDEEGRPGYVVPKITVQSRI